VLLFFLALSRISYFESHFLTERQSVAQSVRKPCFVFFILLAPPFATHFFLQYTGFDVRYCLAQKVLKLGKILLANEGNGIHNL